MALLKLKFTNQELRNLLWAANTRAAVTASDVFYTGEDANSGAIQERTELANSDLADAKAIYFWLLENGKYSEKALKGCPGSGLLAKWKEEYEGEYLGRVVGDDTLLGCARCRMMYDPRQDDLSDAAMCDRCSRIVRPTPAVAEWGTPERDKQVEALGEVVAENEARLQKPEAIVTTANGGDSWAVSVKTGERVEAVATGLSEEKATAISEVVQYAIDTLAIAARMTGKCQGLWVGAITGEVL